MREFKRHLTHVIQLLTLTAVYFASGKLGLTLAFVHPSATAVWPCSGIALGAILIFGYDVWPAIALGAFLVNFTTAGTVETSISIAAGNTLEALIGAYLVFRRAGGRHAMNKASNIFKFAILGGLVSSAIAATVGSYSLVWGHVGGAHIVAPIWLTWWLGDAVGILVVTPLLLLWNSPSTLQWRWKSVLEATALLFCLVFIGLVVFNGLFTSGIRNNPLEYLCVPFLIWAASRFGQREAVLSTLVLSGIAIWGTLHGYGPFARESRNDSMLLLQAFLGVGTVMTLVLASEVSERRRNEREALNLSAIDGLTGLGNYRKLIDTLESEMKRAERTKRNIVLILMDLDGLKKNNDIHGHSAGNRAICRLANVLQIHCRNIDTAARYGGDEFALILPECELKFGRNIAQRIFERLANDQESPVLSVSFGIAVWPNDGATVDELVRKADRSLYQLKQRHHAQARQVDSARHALLVE